MNYTAQVMLTVLYDEIKELEKLLDQAVYQQDIVELSTAIDVLEGRVIYYRTKAALEDEE